MKKIFLKLSLVFLFLGSINALANYSLNKQYSSIGGGTWGSILSMQANLNGSYLTITARKKNGGSFSSSGNMKLKVGTHNSWGANRSTSYVNIGTTYLTFQHNLGSYSNYPKDFYIRYESNSGGYAWAGPITVSKSNPVPSTPYSPSATANGHNSINLSWSSVNNTSLYKLFRSTSASGNYTQIYCSSSRNYADSGVHLSSNTTYYYKLKAGNSEASCSVGATTGWSNYSSYRSVRTSIAIPSTPYSPSATANGHNSINLSWSSVNNTSLYKLFRSTSASGNYTQIYCSSSRNYADSGIHLSSNTTYYYKLKAGNSEASCSVGATTGWSNYSNYRSVLTANIPFPTISSLPSNQNLILGSNYQLTGNVSAGQGDNLTVVTAAVTGGKINGSDTQSMRRESINSNTFDLSEFTFNTSDFGTGTYTVGIWAKTTNHPNPTQAMGSFQIVVNNILSPSLVDLSSNQNLILGSNYQLTGNVSANQGDNLTVVTAAVTGGKINGSDTQSMRRESINSNTFDLSEFTFNTSDFDTGTYTVGIWAKTTNHPNPTQAMGSFQIVVNNILSPSLVDLSSNQNLILGSNYQLTGNVSAGQGDNLTVVTAAVTGGKINGSDTQSMRRESINSNTFDLSEFTFNTSDLDTGTYTVGIWAKTIHHPNPTQAIGSFDIIVSGSMQKNYKITQLGLRHEQPICYNLTAPTIKIQKLSSENNSSDLQIVSSGGSLSCTTLNQIMHQRNLFFVWRVNGGNLIDKSDSEDTPFSKVRWNFPTPTTSLETNTKDNNFNIQIFVGDNLGTEVTIIKSLKSIQLLPIAKQPKILNVSPLTSILNKQQTFTIKGTHLVDGMAFYIPQCKDVQELSGGTSSTRQFQCTPNWSIGDKEGIIKNKTGGDELFQFVINVEKEFVRPTQPIFIEVPNTQMGDPVIVKVQSGADINKLNTKIECTAEDSNRLGNNKYISNWSNQSTKYSINFSFNSTGKKTIWCTTFNYKGLSSAVSETSIIVLKKENANPSSPTLTFPNLDAQNISAITTLDWQSSTDPDNDSIVYNVYLGKEFPPSEVVASSLNNTEYTTNELDIGTKYYWQIKAIDSNNNHSKSLIRYFKTAGSIADDSGLKVAGITNPANGEYLVEDTDFINGRYNINGWCSTNEAKIRVFINDNSLNGTSGSLNCNGSWDIDSRNFIGGANTVHIEVGCYGSVCNQDQTSFKQYKKSNSKTVYFLPTAYSEKPYAYCSSAKNKKIAIDLSHVGKYRWKDGSSYFISVYRTEEDKVEGKGWSHLTTTNKKNELVIDRFIELGKKYYYFITWSFDKNNTPYHFSNPSASASSAQCSQWDAIHYEAIPQNLTIDTRIDNINLNWHRTFKNSNYDSDLEINSLVMYRYENVNCDPNNPSTCVNLTSLIIDEQAQCSDISSNDKKCSYLDHTVENYKKYYYQIKSSNNYVSVYTPAVSGYSVDLQPPNTQNENSLIVAVIHQPMPSYIIKNTGGHSITDCQVNPPLPLGLQINPTDSSCQISGTPTIISSPSTYHIATQNAKGISNSIIKLSVVNIAPPIITQAKPFDNSIQLNWKAVPNAESYIVYWRQGTQVSTTNYNGFMSTTNTILRISSLTNEVNYAFGVVAKQSEQQTAISELVIAKPSGFKWTKTSQWSGRTEHSNIVFKNKMWMIGGIRGLNEIWSSVDGMHWQEEGKTPWSDCCQKAFVFDNKLWYIEYGYYSSGSSFKNNKIWSSVDGINWSFEIEAPWSGRSGFSIVKFNDKIWMMGGKLRSYVSVNDVWSSTNGLSWTKVVDAAWSERHEHATAIFNNKIWVIGGRTGSGSATTYNNEVWSSSNGINWIKKTNAPWIKASNQEVVVFENKLWALGGIGDELGNGHDYLGAWYSADGIAWTESNTPWEKRAGNSATVFNNKLFVIGGRQYKVNDTSLEYYFSDVWSTNNGLNWTKNLDAPFNFTVSSRQGLAFKDTLWLFGEADFAWHIVDDIWSSTNGKVWSKKANVPWHLEHYSIVDFNNKIWVIGGRDENDIYTNEVWSSSDGLNWLQHTNAPWSARLYPNTTVFNNKIWLAGGYSKPNWQSDLWSFDGVNWRQESNPPWSNSGEDIQLVTKNESIFAFIDTQTWSSTNAKTWKVNNSNIGNTDARNHIQVFEDKFWYYASGNLYFSEDGVTWLNLKSPLSSFLFPSLVPYEDKLWFYSSHAYNEVWSFHIPISDIDNDNIADKKDNCLLTPNPSQLNTDQDLLGNACDAFPQDSSETVDTDSDGIGDNADLDDDNDGLTDIWEIDNDLNPKLKDSDGDGVADGFYFATQKDVDRSHTIHSHSIILLGITTGTSISIHNGEYSINNGGYTQSSSTVSSNDIVRLRHQSSTDYLTAVTTTLIIGHIQTQFISITQPKREVELSTQTIALRQVVKQESTQVWTLHSSINIEGLIAYLLGDIIINTTNSLALRSTAGNSFSEAMPISLPSSVSESINPIGENDYYRLEVMSTGSLLIYSESNFDTYGHLYNSSQNQVTFNDDGGSDSNFRINYVALPGVYFIKVRPYSSGTGDYILQVTGTAVVKQPTPPIKDISGLGITTNRIAIGDIAAHTTFTISQLISPELLGNPNRKASWQLRDKDNLLVEILHSSDNRLWVDIITNEPPILFSSTVLNTINVETNTTAYQSIIAIDPNNDTLTYTANIGMIDSSGNWSHYFVTADTYTISIDISDSHSTIQNSFVVVIKEQEKPVIIPNAPSTNTLKAVSIGSTQIALAWSTVTHATFYRLFVEIDLFSSLGRPPIQNEILSSNALSFIHKKLTPNKLHTYTLRACANSDINTCSSTSLKVVTKTLELDNDGDRIVDSSDNCPNHANADQANFDGDPFGDVCDNDIDGDGVINTADAFPTSATESVDTDGDGIGNNADLDDDNDGMPDAWELANNLNPLDASDALADSDGDGFTNLKEYQRGSSISKINNLGLTGYVTGEGLASTTQFTYSTINQSYHLHLRIPENSSGTINLTTIDNDSTAQWNLISYIPTFLVQFSTIKHTFDKLSQVFHTSKDYVWNGTLNMVVEDNNDISTLVITLDIYGVDEKPIYDIPAQITIDDNIVDVTSAITNSSGTIILPIGRYSTTSFIVSITEQDSHNSIDAITEISLSTSQKIIASKHSLIANSGSESSASVPASNYYDIKYAPVSSTHTQKITLYTKLSEASYQDTATLTVLHNSGNQKQFAIVALYQTVDIYPDPFTFTNEESVPLSSVVQAKNRATIWGIDSTAKVTIQNGQFKVYNSASSLLAWFSTGWMGEGETYAVSQGERIAVRHISSNQYNTYTTSTLTIGSYSTHFVSQTRPANKQPNDFNFDKVINAQFNQLVYSNTIILRGFETTANISIEDGEYSIDGGKWQSDPASINAGQLLQLRLTSSDAADSERKATVNIGGMTAEFVVTTEAEDTTFAPINFASISDAPTGTSIVSNPVRITGINTQLAISISGSDAEYSLNYGAYTNTAGQVNDGDNLQLRFKSANSPSTTQVATVIIGGKSFSFIVVTQSADDSESVDDTRAPALQVPQALIIEISEGTNNLLKSDSRIANFLNSAYAVDNVDGEVSVTNNAPDTFPIGETVVLFSVSDKVGNKSEGSASITIQLPPDIEAPVFNTTPEKIDLKASGLFTPISKLGLSTVTATDNRDGSIQAKHNLFYPLLSGKHHIIWTATDKAGNKTQASQEVNIYPQANLLLDQYAGNKSIVKVSAFLTGPSPEYPVVLPLTVNKHQSITNATITIGGSKIGKRQLGLYGEYSFKMAQPDSGNYVEFKMTDDISNAVKGKRTAMKIYYVENKVAPVGKIIVTQDNFETAIVDIASTFTLNAEVFDPNADDTHTYQWNYHKIGNQDNQTTTAQTVQINPSSHDGKGGFMWVKLKVSDRELTSSNERLLRLIDTNNIALSENTDSDGDGISDQKEGIKDSDGDGILDYQDDDQREYVLPTSKTILVVDAEGNTETRTVSMQAKEGQKIRLGSTSIAAGRRNINITLELLKLFGKQGEPADKAENIGEDYEFKGDAVDFEVINIAQAGQSIQVVIPLNNPLVKGAVYRKFHPEKGWKDFKSDAKNAIESAQSDQGVCPDVDSNTEWTSGLSENNDCIRLTIEDGGENDGDGEINAKIADPGAIFSQKSTTGGDTDGNDDDNNNQNTDTTAGGGSGGPACSLTPNSSNPTFSPTFIILLLISIAMILYRRRKVNY